MTLLLAAVVWTSLEPGTRALLEPAGISESNFETWLEAHRQTAAARLREGTAEHIGYYILQSRRLHPSEPLSPLKEARAFAAGLRAESRRKFLRGEFVDATFSEPVRARMDVFFNAEPVDERHRLLRRMAGQLSWDHQRIVQAALRFPFALDNAGNLAEVEDLYQHRGLSGDPYPPSMKAVAAGRDLLSRPPGSLLLLGPGIELGSRFGIEDAKPIASPQPAAVQALFQPRLFHCADIREEVTHSLRNGPCAASTVDIVAGRPEAAYDLIVATNVLAYLTEVELAVAFSNMKQALRPGGCLLHNDARFAIRVAGEAAGLPVRMLQVVPLGGTNGRERMDRAVLHCLAK